MKKFILIASLALAASSAFAYERYLGTAYLNNNDRGEAVAVNSCDGYRDQRMDSITLIVRNDSLNLRQVIVQMEDRHGRPTGMVVGQVRAGVYPVGSRIFVNLPGQHRCVQNVRIVGDSTGGREGGRRPHDRYDDRYDGRYGDRMDRRGPRHDDRDWRNALITKVDIYGEVGSRRDW